MRKYGDYVAVNVNTGEIEKDVIICSKAKAEARQKYKKNEEGVANLKRNKAESRFVWNFFKDTKNFDRLKPQTAARLAYISTYIGYNDNFIKEHDDNITRQEFQSIINLTERSFKDFLSQTKKAHYIIKEASNYRVNSRYFKKGEIKQGDISSDIQATRLYINTYRKLYKNTPVVKHVYLGYVFQLIPYVNHEYNIVCHNPLETNRDNINPITVGQFCDLIGYDKSNASRLINVYRDITFEWQGKEMTFCGYYWEPKKADMRFFVNPLIFFAGSDYHRVEILELCFI